MYEIDSGLLTKAVAKLNEVLKDRDYFDKLGGVGFDNPDNWFESDFAEDPEWEFRPYGEKNKKLCSEFSFIIKAGFDPDSRSDSLFINIVNHCDIYELD